MSEESRKSCSADHETADNLLSRAQELVPLAISKAEESKVFPARWNMINSKLENIPSSLANLSTHPFFSSNVLCKEQLQGIIRTLEDAVELTDKCIGERYEGNLRMQSDLDSLTAAFDLSLRDCATLIKTGVLGAAISSPSSSCVSSESEFTGHGNNVSDLLSRLQIGDLESKHRALAYLIEEIKIDDKCVVDAVGRNHIAPLVQLFTATSQRIREKTVTLIASLVESGSCKNCLVAEGVIPPLIKLVESGTAFAKQKAVISLQRLSVSSDVARAIAGHGGIRPLIDVCRVADPVTQFAAAGTLRNVSAVPDTRHTIAEEGIVGVMMYLLDSGILMGSKERAAECLQHLTISNDSLRRSVISEGGVCRLLTFLDSPLLHESAVATLRNLVSAVPTDKLVSVGFLPCMVHKCGSLGAQHAAASALCRVIST